MAALNDHMKYLKQMLYRLLHAGSVRRRLTIRQNRQEPPETDPDRDRRTASGGFILVYLIKIRAKKIFPAAVYNKLTESKTL